MSIWANQGCGVVLGPEAAPGVVVSGCKIDGNGQGLHIDAKASAYAVTGNALINNKVKSSMAGGIDAVITSNVLTGVDK